MTEDQLNALADIISKKVIAYLDQALDVEMVRPMTPEEFFHANVDAFGNVKHYDQKAVIEKHAAFSECKGCHCSRYVSVDCDNKSASIRSCGRPEERLAFIRS